MLPTRTLAAALPLALTLACAGAYVPTRAAAPLASADTTAPGDTARLRRTLEELVRGYPGVAGVSVIDLRSGARVSVRGDETFPTASLIKVAVLVALLDEVSKGTIRMDERISLLARDRVGGSGVLQYMQSGLEPTVEDAAWLMITLSDNTATNILLDHLNVKTVWDKMEALGLPHTKIHSKTFLRSTSIAVDSSVKYGLGVTTPNETARLFELLHHGRAVSPAHDSTALAMLRANQDATKLARWLPDTVAVAHKTGEVDRSRSDCGIVYGPQAPVVVCALTRENRETSYAVDNPANLLMARIGLAVFRHYNPAVPVAEPPRP
ncbi:MAG TPA: serine hydrolase [Longimicrobium sp.]|nr:serine hydrolase [Longimicrobium sp.]